MYENENTGNRWGIHKECYAEYLLVWWMNPVCSTARSCTVTKSCDISWLRNCKIVVTISLWFFRNRTDLLNPVFNRCRNQIMEISYKEEDVKRKRYTNALSSFWDMVGISRPEKVRTILPASAFRGMRQRVMIAGGACMYPKPRRTMNRQCYTGCYHSGTDSGKLMTIWRKTGTPSCWFTHDLVWR